MVDVKAGMEEFEATAAGKAQAAADDLRRIEQEVVAEAEASVADYDAMGDETAAVAAAETAFDFDEAQQVTAGR